MPIATICPHCRHAGNVPDTFAGKNVKCPGCKQRFRIPDGSASPAVQPQPAPTTKAPDEFDPFADMDEPTAGSKHTKQKPRGKMLAFVGVLLLLLLGMAGWLFSSNGVRLPFLARTEKDVIIDYLKKNLDDPTDFEVVEWGKPEHVLASPIPNGESSVDRALRKMTEFGDEKALPKKEDPGRKWRPATFLLLRYRAKNRLGAREVFEYMFLVMGDEVVYGMPTDQSINGPGDYRYTFAKLMIHQRTSLDFKEQDDK